MWAQKAMPAPILPKETNPNRNWYKNQNPKKKNAGISTISQNRNKGTKVNTLALGNIRKYAPKIPAIAPEAPTAGTLEPQLKRA